MKEMTANRNKTNMLVVLPCKCTYCNAPIDASTVRYENEWLNPNCVLKKAVCPACGMDMEHDIVPEIEARLREMKSSDEKDAFLESLWAEFGDIPMDPDTEKIDAPFLFFDTGTEREDIWHWFDEKHSKGVAYLLYSYEEVDYD